MLKPLEEHYPVGKEVMDIALHLSRILAQELVPLRRRKKTGGKGCQKKRKE
jgi:hypothetical protein